jgi:hypothetical protein
MNEQTTKQTPVQYAGVHTRADLQHVECGYASIATLKRSLKTSYIWSLGGDLRMSRQEAVSILEEQQEIKKTPKELIAQMTEYQRDIRHIECEPDCYVAPERARAWYEKQIARIRQQTRMASGEVL